MLVPSASQGPGSRAEGGCAGPLPSFPRRSLRKALNDAVMIDVVMTSNPTLKAKLPREGYREPRVV